MRRDTFSRVFDVVFPVMFVVAALLALGGAIAAVHFVRKFW